MGDSERESGDGNWLVTYSDLVTLLLVFFVLLYVLTPGLDQSRFNDFISHFQSSVSIVKNNNEVSRKSSDNSLRKEWKQVKKFVDMKGLSSEVQIEKIEDGVKVTLSDSLTFNSGSAKLLSRAKVVLGKIRDILGTNVRAVKAQGHTDNVPISESSIYRSNWHLGAARAVSVVLFLRDNAKVAPRKFEASSFGKYKPIATNETPEGRRKNRRVEIYVRYKKNQADSVKKSTIN